MKTNLLFADYKKEKSFDGILAIEPELGTKYLRKDGVYKAEFKGLRGHNESGHIREIDNMHKIETKRRMELIDTFTKDYKGYFTLGSSKHPSGGVHFHVFSQYKMKEGHDLLSKVKVKATSCNIYNTLLYCVTDEGKFYMRRYIGMFYDMDNTNKDITLQNRWGLANLKTDYLPGIEYRCNNVFDVRLYGYYTAITLLGIYGIKLSSPFKNTTYKNEFKDGINEELQHSESDELGRIHCSKYKKAIDINDEKNFSLILLKRNLGKLLFVLTINKLHKAREALEEYIKENIGIEIKAVAFDFITGDIIKSKECFTLETSGVVLLFVNKNSINTLIRRMMGENNIYNTLTDQALEPLASKLTKINLITK